MPTESHLCKQCKAPINETCQCEECRELSGIQRKHKIYCHVCEVQYRIVVGSPFLARAHDEWKQANNEKRKNMGL